MKIHAIESSGYAGHNPRDYHAGKLVKAHSYWLESVANVRHENVVKPIRCYQFGKVTIRVYVVRFPNLRRKVGEPAIWQAYRGMASRTIRYSESIRYFDAECREQYYTRKVCRESVAYLKSIDLVRLDRIALHLREKERRQDEVYKPVYDILDRQRSMAMVAMKCPRLAYAARCKGSDLAGRLSVALDMIA